MFIKDYEIIDKITDTENYKYEEITVKELIEERLSLEEHEKNDSVKQLFAVNLHYMLSLETYDRAFDIIDDIASDPRLEKFNAIVFLQYKHKNKKSTHHSILDIEKYKKLIKYCDKKKVKYGFDSCSANLYLESIKDEKNKEELEKYAEPCESGLFSSYINCYGEFFVCSFSEGEDTWKEGINVLTCNDFLEDVWNHPRLKTWRKRLINNKRECPIYNLSMEKILK